MKGSIQEKLNRVRPPRVKITYDVETGGAIQIKELPFIVGIFADLSGQPKDPLPPLKERKLVEIDRDNFDTVMGSISPRLALRKSSFEEYYSVQIEEEKKLQEIIDQKWEEEKKERLAKGETREDLEKEEKKRRSRPFVDFGFFDGGLLKDDDGNESGELIIRFENIDDFLPNVVAKKVNPLNVLLQERNHLRDLLAKLDGNDKLDSIFQKVLANEDGTQDTLKTDISGLMEKIDGAESDEDRVKVLEDEKIIIKEGEAEEGEESILRSLVKNMIQDNNQALYAVSLINQFVASIIKDGYTQPEVEDGGAVPDATGLSTDRISEIDDMMTKQVNAIMHHPDFQKLEASWRGLHYLVMNTETGTQLKLKILNVSKQDLLKDLTKAVEFDQSALFKMIYEEEYGTYGGNPYSALIGDYQFGRHPTEDMLLLEKISEVAAAAHAPFVSAAYAKLFDMDDFAKLYKPRDLSKIFESTELIKWRSFRDTEDSRYVTLTLPRVMLRLPYGKDTIPVEGLDFEEDADGRYPQKYLWGNPAYILGQRITNAFSLYGWTAAIRGVEGGGLIEGLPAHTFKTDDGDIALACPTEVAITDRREKELNDLGFMAICHCKGSDKAAFFGGQTTNLPKKFNTDEANANARISSMLPYVLAASRFAHYIKAIMREKIGSTLTAANIQDYLNKWIAMYILLDDDASLDAKAKYPLRAAKVEITDDPGKPGSYNATIFLRPHFQLEELTTSIRLVANIPG